MRAGSPSPLNLQFVEMDMQTCVVSRFHHLSTSKEKNVAGGYVLQPPHQNNSSADCAAQHHMRTEMYLDVRAYLSVSRSRRRKQRVPQTEKMARKKVRGSIRHYVRLATLTFCCTRRTRARRRYDTTKISMIILQVFLMTPGPHENHRGLRVVSGIALL